MTRQATDRVEYRGRSATDAGLEVRSTAAGPMFVGHGAVVNARTSIGNPLSWGFYEELAPGAFDRTLADCDARFLVDHDTSKLVARQSAGDLRLGMDSIGLGVEADLDTEVSYVRDLARNVEKRRITGMSFGFIVRSDEWSTVDVETTDDQGKTYTAQADLRVINDVDLFEVSAVTFPAYEETDAALRALQFNPTQLTARMEQVKQADVDKRMIGRALDLMQELRVGKVLSAANLNILQSILDQLAEADRSFDPLVNMVNGVDGALDQAQADLADLLGVPDPDEPEPDDGDRAATGFVVPPAEHVSAFAARYGLTLPD